MANDQAVTIPALGRQGFSLGCLYDLTTHQIYQQKLWDEDDLKDDKLDIKIAESTNFDVETSNTQDERCKALDVEADIKLDISGGAVKVEGSAKYLNSSNSNSQVCSVTYTSKKVTKTKSLNMTQMGKDKVTHLSILDDEKHATHYVSSITYGKNAHFRFVNFSPLYSHLCLYNCHNYYFRFESKVTDKKEKDKIAGRMELAISSIKTSGAGSIDHNSEEDKFVKEITCEFFGDYSGITPPFNIEMAKKTILEIEADKDEATALGVPIKVTLTPLSSLTKASTRMVKKLSAGAINKASELLQDIEDIQVGLNTLLRSETAAEFYNYKTTINKIADIYRNQGSELKGKLSQILTKIKRSDGSAESEEELREAIREYNKSPFSKAKTEEWLKSLEEEVIFVDSLIKLAAERNITKATSKSAFQTEKMRARQGMFYFEAKFVSCLAMTADVENGEAPLRPTGSVLDDDEFLAKFNMQFNHFTNAISEGLSPSEVGLRNDDAKFNSLFYLEFMAEENQCDIKFLERGTDALREINTDAEVGSVKYESHDNTVTGEIRDKVTEDTCPVAAKGGFINLQLRYTEDKAEVGQSDEERSWEDKKQKHAAEKTSFEFDLGQLHGLHEGSQYRAQLRYQIR